MKTSLPFSSNLPSSNWLQFCRSKQCHHQAPHEPFYFMCGYVTFYKYISENVLTYCCATFTKIMNLFLLSVSPRRAVRLYGQRHVIKMVLEACQLMNNVYHIHECSIKPCTYRPTHMRHPWSIWASRRKRNFIILGAFAIAMCVEFRRRRGKPHKCEQQIIHSLLSLLSHP